MIHPVPAHDPQLNRREPLDQIEVLGPDGEVADLYAAYDVTRLDVSPPSAAVLFSKVKECADFPGPPAVLLAFGGVASVTLDLDELEHARDGGYGFVGLQVLPLTEPDSALLTFQLTFDLGDMTLRATSLDIRFPGIPARP